MKARLIVHLCQTVIHLATVCRFQCKFVFLFSLFLVKTMKLLLVVNNVCRFNAEPFSDDLLSKNR